MASANPTLKDLTDLIRHKARLKVTCPKCGRSGIYDVTGVIEYFRYKRFNTAWEAAGTYFRCDGGFGEAGCGHKGALLDMVPIPEPLVIPQPEPTELQLRQEARRRR